MRRGVAPLLLLFGLSVAVLVLSHRDLRERRANFPKDQDVLYLPPAHHLRVMSLGYQEALADLVWIRAVIFTGDTIGGQNFAWIERYLEAIFELAPTFRRPYAWGGVTSVYSGLDPDRESTDRAIALYRQGLVHFPEDHEMLFALGMLLIRDVSSFPLEYSAQERAEAKAEGALLIRKSAAFGAPPLVRQLAASLVSNEAVDQLAIQFLETQLLMTEDEKYRRMLRKKLTELVGSTKTRSVEVVKRSFNEERLSTFPYLPHDVYAVIRDDVDRR